MICDKCERNVSRKVLRNMGAGVHYCKDCYAGNPIVQAVQEIVERTVRKSVQVKKPLPVKKIVKKTSPKEETRILKKKKQSKKRK